MSEPTAYDLTQDEKIAEHSELLQVSDVAATGNQISYPVVGQPLTDAQWQTIAASMGNGVISHGGGPYQIMRPSNLDDTVTITTSPYTGNATSILSGYFHELRASMKVNIPPVSATTTYHICLTYDPLRSQAADGPVSIQVYAGTPPTAGGKQHIVLGKIVRQPNQVLTDAQFLRVRPMISPTAWVLQERDLPDPATQLWGSAIRVHQTGKTFIACSDYNDEAQAWSGRPDKWEELDPADDTGWIDVSGIIWPESNAQARKEGRHVELRGEYKRPGGLSSGNSVQLYAANFFRGYTPTVHSAFVCAAGTTDPGSWNTIAQVYITPGGELSIRNITDGIIRRVNVAGIRYSID